MFRVITLILTLLTGIFIFTQDESKDHVVHPRPTNGVPIPGNMEDGSTKNLKKAWFEAIHGGHPDTDWRKIERDNQLQNYKELNANLNRDQGFVSLPDGSVSGVWQEKGSINQSGSIIKSTWNEATQKVLAIADGGSLWSGLADGSDWSVEEQALRFDGRFLDVVYPPGMDYRIIASAGGLPMYKDSDQGIWVRAEGVSSDFSPENKDQIISLDGDNIFYLIKTDLSQNVQLMHSNDHGASYRAIKTFGTIDLDDVSLAADMESNAVYAIEGTSFNRSSVYIFNEQSRSLTLLNLVSQIGFGSSGKANLKALKEGSLTKLFVYDGNNNLKFTINNGHTWNTLSTLPVTPWDPGLFVSAADPRTMMIGAIEAYLSKNGGRTWTKVNNWGQYYSDPEKNLHADIMHIAEWDTPTGSQIAVSNHGGLSRSLNGGYDFDNIGTEGLNTSQYYSVKTSPIDEDFIFAGSQDQGLQKGRDLGEGPVSFRQLKAGDYGHLQYTNFGRSLWAIYPGGNMYFYPDPILSDVSNQPYALLLNNPSVWIPPIIASPYKPNGVLIAGGSLLNTTGSHIVDVSVDDFAQLFGTQWPFDFSVSGGDVSAMAHNKAATNQFYVLTTNGKFFKSINRGVNFTQKTAGLADAHHLYGNTILTSSIDPNKVLIGGSGYDNPAVFISNDAGESFAPMTDGLPPTTVFQMAYDTNEEFIFAATEAGPYVYAIHLGRWYELGQGKAPNQRYWSVEYLASSQKVRYGTYGRGIWDLDLETLTSTEELTSSPEIDLHAYPNPAQDKVTIKLPSHQEGELMIISPDGGWKSSLRCNGEKDVIIDISHYSHGIYYLIFDDGNTVSSDIIIKI